MAKVSGLVLRGADGGTYFIEGGIRAARLAPSDATGSNDLAAAIAQLDLGAGDQRVADLQDALRAERGLAAGSLHGPFVFQAHNVEVDRNDLGDVVTIQSAASFTGF